MAKKYVYQKSETGVTDFVYIDLLPEMKNVRHFNVNVIIALLLLVVSAFVLIYLPYRNATVEYEELNGLNFDLKHELLLTQEEVQGYNIDTSVIGFQNDINDMKEYKLNFNNYIDDLVIVTQLQSGRITEIAYSSDTNLFTVQIAIVTPFTYNILNNEILNLAWVSRSTYSTPTRLNGEVEYISTYEIEVNTDVE
jgi:hypothetical protein